MSKRNQTPSLADIYQLRQQIEQDHTAAMSQLRARDRAIGEACQAVDDVGKLLFWLERTRPEVNDEHDAPLQQEAALAIAVQISALVFGGLSMVGFLFGNDKVQVFVLFFLFVLLQLVFSAISIWVIARSSRGAPAVVLPINPMTFVLRRMLPDKRFYRECYSVVRLLALRYGQAAGAFFTLGALLGLSITFVGVGFTWVWGTEYAFIKDHMKQITDAIALPWASWMPSAVMSNENIQLSYFVRGSSVATEKAQGWNLFLVMAMTFYALLPRLVLYGVTRYIYNVQLRQSFARYPGSERILARMVSPVVQTQEEDRYVGKPQSVTESGIDRDLIVVDWGGALELAAEDNIQDFGNAVAAHTLLAGTGSLQADLQCARQINAGKYQRLKVVVKAWEPPLGELRDFLSNLEGIKHCTLCLLPMKHGAVRAASLDDWNTFSRSLSIDVVSVEVLERL
ncbi:MAG: DUF2868 domain-containing protein [Halioglobus sp.]